MPTTCEIKFENNPMKVIYAGQLLRGTVQLTLVEEKNVRGVYIEIRGKASTSWMNVTGNNRRRYASDRDYLNERTYFVGDGSGEIRLAPGTYNYTFQCLMPAGLPSSIDGAYGHVRYKAHVVLDIPMWTDKEFEEEFTVLKVVDLNAMPELKEPVARDVSELFLPCCLLCCFVSDPMNIVARMPASGYAPGQTINLEIYINNESTQLVSEFNVRLNKEVTFYADGQKRRQNIAANEEITRGCGINQEETIRVSMEVPATTIPTDDTSSNLIQVKYSMQIVASVGCCHPDPVLELPITIGPFQDAMNSRSNVIWKQPTAPSARDVAAFPNAPAPPGPSAPLMTSHDDPPNYEEAIHLNDVKLKTKRNSFKIRK